MSTSYKLKYVHYNAGGADFFTNTAKILPLDDPLSLLPLFLSGNNVIVDALSITVVASFVFAIVRVAVDEMEGTFGSSWDSSGGTMFSLP